MKVRAIVNPSAGLRNPRALAAVQAPPPPGIELEVRRTEAAGHAVELAREAAAAGYERVLAVGGDGTANEVATGLLGTQTALGLLPVGSGNGLARALGLPLEPEAALRTLLTSPVRAMDVGFVNGRPFLNVAGIGFDAAVGRDFHEWGLRGGRRGLWSYLRLGLKRGLRYRPESYRVETESGRFEGRAFAITFANGVQYGNGAVVAPGSRLDDGVFDVVVFEGASILAVLLATPLLFLGRIDLYPRYRRFATTRATVVGRGPHHRDGEPEAEADILEVELRPGVLRVVVPEATLRDPRGPFTPA